MRSRKIQRKEKVQMERLKKSFYWPLRVLFLPMVCMSCPNHLCFSVTLCNYKASFFVHVNVTVLLNSKPTSSFALLLELLYLLKVCTL